MVAGITHGRNERKGQVQEQEGRWQVSHLAGLTGRGRRVRKRRDGGITLGRTDRKGQEDQEKER